MKIKQFIESNDFISFISVKRDIPWNIACIIVKDMFKDNHIFYINRNMTNYDFNDEKLFNELLDKLQLNEIWIFSNE